MSFARLILRNLNRRRVRSGVLIAAMALLTAMGFLGVVLLGGLEQSLDVGFERLGADLLVVQDDAAVNITQAMLAVEPEAPPLSAAVLQAMARLPQAVTVSPQRAVRSTDQLSMELGLPHGTTLPLYGIDPLRDSTVQPWLDDHRGIDFQDGQVILGHRARGRLGDRLRLGQSTFQIYGRLAPSGVPSHENGLFFTLHDLQALLPSATPDTLGINGLLVQGPADQPIELLRFRLLARLEGV
jgi:putative ABC transport system permease protein